MTVAKRMRAVHIMQHGDPDVLEVTQVRTPSPQPGQVLVRVSTAALNNTDVWTKKVPTDSLVILRHWRDDGYAQYVTAPAGPGARCIGLTVDG